MERPASATGGEGGRRCAASVEIIASNQVLFDSPATALRAATKSERGQFSPAVTGSVSYGKISNVKFCSSEKRGIRFEAEQDPADRLHDPRVDADMLCHRVHISERSLQRAACV